MFLTGIVSISATYVLLLCTVLTHHEASSANILVNQVICSYSHRLSSWPLLVDLANAGHNITVISPYVMKTPDARIKEYIPKVWQKTLGNWGDETDFYGLRKRGLHNRLWLDMFWWGVVACEALYEDQEFIEWMRSIEKVDLVILDTDFNECAYGMVKHWNAKLIQYSTSNVMGYYHDQFGLPDETSSITDTIMNFPPGKQMSFYQRFINGLLPVAWLAAREWYYFPKLESVSRTGLAKVTGKEVRELPSFSEIEKNSSLVFVTAHFSMSYQRSFPPNIVEIGGTFIAEKVDPLPKDIEDFIGNDPDGFIYMSLGSVLVFTNFPEETQKAFIDAIKAFPKIKFIWKSDKPITAPLPANVKVLSWAPQMSILAHPKIRGFITHSGLGSTMEAITFGVPVVTFPLFAEQDMNAGMVSSRGAGITLEITDVKGTELEDALREILDKPKYKINS